MKPILVLQHVPHETLGTIETALTEAGLPWEYLKLFRGIPRQPDISQSAGMVVLGGPMNVDQTDEFPFLAAEIDWIREAVDRGLPVLGVCLGSQLLAKALGAAVRPSPVKEIGWYPLQLTPEAQEDRLLTRCTRDQTVFQWHGDTFDLPAGAVLLARSELCENQAFRYGENAYAFQFHIEVTARMIDRWLDQEENRREVDALDHIDPQVIRDRTPEELPGLRALSSVVFGRFAAMT
ncbi:MAG: gamma-glutamyl-gamma-aminobutyrate hydrolase family protein [Thermoguttaceae bacterium]